MECRCTSRNKIIDAKITNKIKSLKPTRCRQLNSIKLTLEKTASKTKVRPVLEKTLLGRHQPICSNVKYKYNTHSATIRHADIEEIP